MKEEKYLIRVVAQYIATKKTSVYDWKENSLEKATKRFKKECLDAVEHDNNTTVYLFRLGNKEELQELLQSKTIINYERVEQILIEK